MIYIGSHVFEITETPQKILKFMAVDGEPMGPYRNGELSPALFETYREETMRTLHLVTKKIFNEGYYMKPKSMEYLESLAKTYEFTSLIAWFERYWQDRGNISFYSRLPAEAKNRLNIVHENMKEIRAFKDEIALTDDGPAMRLARVSYLEIENSTLMSTINEMETRFQSMEDRDYEGWWIETAKELSGYEKIAGKYRSNKITIAHLKGIYDKKKVVVTDDMIAEAKKVPFNKLLKLEVVGNRAKALCPFHNEETPSFVVYASTNRGHCHGCGKNVDTIQFLVETKKLEFNQAVLMLLDY